MVRYILGIIATLSILFLLAITAMLALNSLPFFGEYSLNDFLLGDKWRPADEPPMFGILPLLWGSLLGFYQIFRIRDFIPSSCIFTEYYLTDVFRPLGIIAQIIRKIYVG